MRPKYSGLHSLRHYAISSWLKTCNSDFNRVQSWAGHATLAGTWDTYGHLFPRHDDHELSAAAERDLFA